MRTRHGMEGNALPQGAEQTLRGKGGFYSSQQSPHSRSLPPPPAVLTSTMRAHCVPLPAPGPPRTKTTTGFMRSWRRRRSSSRTATARGRPGGGRGAGGERRAPGPGLALRQNRRRAPAAELSAPRESASGSPAARADREGRGGHVRAGLAAAAPPSGAQRAALR